MTTKEEQNNISPNEAIKRLVDGNKRFTEKATISQNLNDQVSETSEGQSPFAVILSCIDSRVPVELVFDQGIGDVFSTRVAGNIVNEDVLGSIEYSCNVAGSKALVVLGHTKCGAVTAACQNVELGNITALLSKIKPAINTIEKATGYRDVEKVAEENVRQSILELKAKSDLLRELEEAGGLKIVGAIYNVSNGAVRFL